MGRAVARPKQGIPFHRSVVLDRTPEHGQAELAGLALGPAERQYLDSTLEGLTEREREVVYALLDAPDRPGADSSNASVADRLCVALPTLRTHLMRINQKLGTSSKSDLVRLVACRLLEGYRRGALEPNGQELSARAR